jgi:2-polyprenyl-3-methyl-5-hydroxy-6-metoxy-1,4-benzoquinol methylase
MNEIQEYYDGRYHIEQHGGQLLEDYSLAARVAFFQQYCCTQQNCSVMDFGCGTGGILSSLRDIDQERSLGIDVSSSAIEMAKARFPHLNWMKVAIGCPLPQAQRFDAVIASEVIEHVFDVDSFLQQLRDVLKDNGRLGLTCPYHGFWKDLAIVLSGKAEAHYHNPDDPHIRFYSLRGLRRVLSRNGFELQETRPICPYFGVSALSRMVGVVATKA